VNESIEEHLNESDSNPDYNTIIGFDPFQKFNSNDSFDPESPGPIMG